MTQGAYRRRIDLATRQIAENACEARVAIEDDHHHFRISVFSLNGVVSEVSSQTLRAPTLMCPSAGPRLQEIVGMALAPSCAATLSRTDPYHQCTHLIEMAGLAVAALARGQRRRIYEAEVSYDEGATRPIESRSTATLRRDGETVLRWRLDSMKITEPVPYAGRSIIKGFMAFVRELNEEEGEAALTLRRAVYTSLGRGMDLDAPDASKGGILGQCWAWQPERADRALRNIGTTWDFSDRPEALTVEDRDWVAFSA